MSRDPSVGMRKDERGAWVNRYGEVLYVVTIEGNRFLIWARNAPGAVNEAIWQNFTRRNRKAPDPRTVAVRSATDDEAAELLRHRASRQTTVQRGQQTFDGIPRDARLDRLLADSPGIVGRDHPETAKRAARSVSVKTGTQRHRVLALIRDNPTGLTDEEIQTAGVNANSERPRRIELLDAGYIAAAKETRKTKAGLDAIIWVITPEGEAALMACAAKTTPS